MSRNSIEEQVVHHLKVAQCLLYTVESCTGGLIANLITDVSGASTVFAGSSVVYDNSMKQALGVPESIITQNGAVSPEVALALAEQGLNQMKNNPTLPRSYALLKPKSLICVATTGIAGPSGGTPVKPVGLCYIGLAKSNPATQPTTLIECFVEKFQAQSPSPPLDSSLDLRKEFKKQFAHKALELILRNLP